MASKQFPLESFEIPIEKEIVTAITQMPENNVHKIAMTKDGMPLVGLTVEWDEEKEIWNGREPEPFYLKPIHTLVAGATGDAGKTTCIEGFTSRWLGQKILVFVTKRGEESFDNAEMMQPFLRPRCDWQYVESIIAAALEEKENRILRSTIMTVCRGATSLEQVWTRVKARRKELDNGKSSGFERSMYIQLDEYLEIVIPQIRKFKFTDRLNFRKDSTHKTIHKMDLTRFTPELQAMIIGSVCDEIMAHHTGVTVVIPEAWEIIPQGRGSPAKLQVERLARKGRTLKNFLVVDSQDIVGIHTPIRKQLLNRILGKQAEENEIEHTLEALSLPKFLRPEPHQIGTLELGQFYAFIANKVKKIFAVPAWMAIEQAVEIAKNPQKVYEVKRPKVERTATEVEVVAEVEPVEETKEVTAMEQASDFRPDAERIQTDISVESPKPIQSLKQIICQSCQRKNTEVNVVCWNCGKVLAQPASPVEKHEQQVTATPLSIEEISVAFKTAKVTIVKERIHVQFTDSSIEGCLLILAKKGELNKFLTASAINEKLMTVGLIDVQDSEVKQTLIKLCKSPFHLFEVNKTASGAYTFKANLQEIAEAEETIVRN